MSRFNPYNLAHSFCYAILGVARSLWYERNLRIHIFAASYVIYFSRYFNLSIAEYAVLFLTVGLVISCEMINTSIEAAVDLYVTDYRKLAQIAKDAAAGAVLVSSAASAAVGVCLFYRPDVIKLIWSDIISAPFVWISLASITAFLTAWPKARQIKDGTVKHHPNHNDKETL